MIISILTTYGKLYADKINGKLDTKSQFLREKVNFDAHYLTDVLAKYVAGGIVKF